jgi:drug/metabolite transporter (DMT)-like permease
MLWPLRRKGLTARQARLFAARGVVHTVGVLCWFYAMTRIPLAEVTAMNYLNPIYVTLGRGAVPGGALGGAAAPARSRRPLVGALLILRPGLRAVEAGHLAMLGRRCSLPRATSSPSGSRGRCRPRWWWGCCRRR